MISVFFRVGGGARRVSEFAADYRVVFTLRLLPVLCSDIEVAKGWVLSAKSQLFLVIISIDSVRDCCCHEMIKGLCAGDL